jgi:hypothetical protein
MYLKYAAVTRPRIGAHHLLHQEPNRILAVERAPIGGARLFDRNFAWFALRTAAGRRNGRPCPYPFWSIPNDFAGRVGKKLKTSSTMAIKAKDHTHFSWQSGYGAFSVSQSAKESVIEYIANQESHHCKMTFQEEFRTILKKHGIPFDERYVWD